MKSSASSLRVPKYRKHAPSGLAVVRLNGQDFYLGRHGTPESQAEYDRVIGEWIANGRQAPPRVVKRRVGQMSVNELILAYASFADTYYRKNGVPTGEYDQVRYSLRPLRRTYGELAVDDFGPLALKTVREEMIKADLCRREINKRVGRIVRMFKWGVENEFVSAMCHHALSQVRGLAPGRSPARESEPVRPASDTHIDAVKPFVGRRVWAMIELQRLTGMRPGEVCIMRTGDIDNSGETWIYRPCSHKTQHHGHERKVWLGPKAQAALKPWLQPACPNAYLFSPQDELGERTAIRRATRKTKVQPSQARRARKKDPQRAPRRHYVPASYGRAIARACERAGIPPWTPHQIRHSAATRIRREHGLDVASLILGHRGVGVTQVYAERDEVRTQAVVARIG